MPLVVNDIALDNECLYAISYCFFTKCIIFDSGRHFEKHFRHKSIFL